MVSKAVLSWRERRTTRSPRSQITSTCLHLASKCSEKEPYYKKAAELYNDARAWNNLATIAFAKGDLNAAQSYAEKAQKIDGNNAESNANLGLLALAAGNVKEAENYIAKAGTAVGINEIVGNLNLMKGNYAQAEQDFAGINSNSAALTQILNKNYNAAANTLSNIKNADATTDYLKAIHQIALVLSSQSNQF